jgi:CRP-like cAMP-binding protein
MRDQIMFITYGEIINNIEFFKINTDSDFMWKVLPILRPIKLEDDDVLYFKGDNAQDFYFISTGKIKLHTLIENLQVPFTMYEDGKMFGDSDALVDLPRDAMAQAIGPLTLKCLNVKQFEELFMNS